MELFCFVEIRDLRTAVTERGGILKREKYRMAIVANTWIDTEEIARRVGRLQAAYAGHPLVKRIDYRIGMDWSEEPAVFIDVVLARDDAPTEEVVDLTEKIREDIHSLRTIDIGLISYLGLKKPNSSSG